MQKQFMIPLMILLFVQVNAQGPFTTKARLDTINAWLVKYRDTTNFYYSHNGKRQRDSAKLVSYYTFRKLIQRDFSKITIGENSFSKVGRFATVSLNTTESKFYFTPVTFVKDADPLKGSFRQIHSIDFSGTINDKKVFEFDSKYSLKGGYSWTFITGGYTPKQKARDTGFNQQIVNAVYRKTSAAYHAGKTDLVQFLAHSEALDSTISVDSAKLAVKKTFFSTLYELEEKYYDNKWDKKRITWFKINIIPISWDNFSMLDTATNSVMLKPLKKNLFTPSLKFSLNRYTKYNVNELYWSLFTGVAKKHTLSEVTSTAQWYDFKKLSETTQTGVDDQKIYALKPAELKQAFRPEIGGQLIWLINQFPNFNFGFDFSASYGGMVSSQSGAAVSKNSVGIVFPFLDKEGKSTINIEFFYQAIFYINAGLSNDTGWGLKFGLPFNRL